MTRVELRWRRFGKFNLVGLLWSWPRGVFALNVYAMLSSPAGGGDISGREIVVLHNSCGMA